MTAMKRFDRLLKAMVQGEPPKRPSRPDQKANEDSGEKPHDAK